MDRFSQLLCPLRPLAMASGLFLACMPLAWSQPLGPQAAEDLQTTWKPVQLDEDVAATRYGIRDWDGQLAIEAHADNSMTLLARRVEADLQRKPVLCWNWRIDAPLQRADLARKSGDDYAARVYLAFAVDQDDLSFTTRAKLRLARLIYGQEVPDAAINYVWDNRAAIGTLAANAYTDRAQMFVLESGKAQTGRWVTERRNILQDFRQAFGHMPGSLVLLAVASDTDNTGERAHAGFAGFALVGENEPCPC